MNNDQVKSKEETYQTKLLQAHNDAETKLLANINVYKSLVSAIKSYSHNLDKFPNKFEMQEYLHELLQEINFKDSLAVSLVSKDQTFLYSVTPFEIDPFGLEGLNVRKMRPKSEIDKLDSLMKFSDKITLFAPINLIEGYPAFPFNFSAKTKNDSVIGYIAPVLSTNYLLQSILEKNKTYEFYHKFSINGNEFNRFKVYDGTKSRNKKKDRDKVLDFDNKNYKKLISNIDFCGLNLQIETRYKNLEKQEIFFPILIFAWFILFVIFIIISLIQLKKNQDFVIKLKKANEEISQKSMQQEKNILQIQNLVKEIHHRVKNNLQIISSLLNLQSSEQTDPKIIHILQMSKTRVESMGLVHSKLYGNENFKSINLKEYTFNLMENISEAMNSHTKKVNSSIHIPSELEINIDTIIPLGLIINELATNSFKYAFHNVESPEISIQIEKSEENKQFKLIYTDNGSGFDFEKIQNSSFGLELIKMLTEQLKGDIAYERENNSKTTIVFYES